ncbi:DUF2795 domain-containing protein [Candidatus Parcubacteria bacterium]|nr:DUF2795 domain-containing protein [Candidatus Parcubacteria bacterium]
MATIVNPVQVQKYLRDIEYPCAKEDLITAAKTQGADESVISTLQQLPGMMFNSPAEVTAAVSKAATKGGGDMDEMEDV